MSKTTRKARARSATPGTIAANRLIEIINEPQLHTKLKGSHRDNRRVRLLDVFTEDELRTATVSFKNAAKERVSVWRAGDGEWFRTAVRCLVRADADGVTRFTVVLMKGANAQDVQFAKAIIGRARDGDSADGWEPLTSDLCADGDGRAYQAVFVSRAYVDPYMNGDGSSTVTACDEPRCQDKVHDVHGHHTLDEIEGGLARGGGRYAISVRKRLGKAGDSWEINVETDELYGQPEDVSSLVNDLQWAAETCRRANQGDAAATDARTPEAPLAVAA